MNALLFFIYSMIIELLNATTLNERLEYISLGNYDKFKPPSKKGEPAHIYIGIAISDIDNIDDAKMEYSIQIYLSELWKDERLNLSYLQTEQDDAPILPSYIVERIWVPDLVFDNTKDGKLFHLTLPNRATKVLKDGFLSRTSRYNLIVNCPMNFLFYPMDTQRCIFKIANFAYADSKVLLHWLEEKNKAEESITLPYEIIPLKYELTELVPHKVCEMWPGGNYTFLNAKFTFSRRISGAIFNVYVPSTLVVLLSWISFWVDVEVVPARITLGVTSLLTLTTQIVQAHSGLPPISYMTAMDIWLFGCLIAVFSVLVEYAFAYQFFILIQEPPDSHDKFQSERSRSSESKIRTLKSRKKQELERTSVNYAEIRKSIVKKFKGNKYLDKICRKIFPFLFSLFSVFYWLYFLCNK